MDLLCDENHTPPSPSQFFLWRCHSCLLVNVVLMLGAGVRIEMHFSQVSWILLVILFQRADDFLFDSRITLAYRFSGPWRRLGSSWITGRCWSNWTGGSKRRRRSHWNRRHCGMFNIHIDNAFLFQLLSVWGCFELCAAFVVKKKNSIGTSLWKRFFF